MKLAESVFTIRPALLTSLRFESTSVWETHTHRSRRRTGHYVADRRRGRASVVNGEGTAHCTSSALAPLGCIVLVIAGHSESAIRLGSSHSSINSQQQLQRQPQRHHHSGQRGVGSEFTFVAHGDQLVNSALVTFVVGHHTFVHAQVISSGAEVTQRADESTPHC